jgi:hypothetical protein
VTSTKRKVLAIAAMLLVATAGLSQKRQEKPKLHSDFKFGSYPVSRDAAAMLSKENVRLVLVGLHQGWDLEKIAKESKVKEEELEKVFADLEEAKLAVELDQFERRPMLPVIRDRDIEKVQKSLPMHTQEYTDVLRNNWAEIEAAIAPLTGAKGVPKPQMMYELVVGGILFGGMQDAFFEDQTLMVSPPRRTGSQRYYAWLVESDAKLAGVLKREQWESDGYTMVSIGPRLADTRISLDRLRMENGMVLEEPEARRLRSFIAIFTKERLLPYFKKNRASFLTAMNQLDAGRYVSVSSAFAWYYDQMANGVAENLVAAKLIQPPADRFAFALKAAGAR